MSNPKDSGSELIRIVRMTLKPDSVDLFLAIFQRAAPRIRATPGCLHLELWQDVRYPNLISTYSRWSSPQALDSYRKSAFFQATWSETRELFAAPASAHSHHRVETGH